MRVILGVTLAFVLALPASAAALRLAVDEPGTLSIRNGKGVVQFNARGSILGRFDQGQIRITDPNPDDEREPIVRGAEREREVSDTTVVYSGRNLRFRIVGARFKLRVSAVDIDLSVVGRGRVTLNGSERFADDPGEYSQNGYAYVPIPLSKTVLQLAPDPED